MPKKTATPRKSKAEFVDYVKKQHLDECALHLYIAREFYRKHPEMVTGAAKLSGDLKRAMRRSAVDIPDTPLRPKFELLVHKEAEKLMKSVRQYRKEQAEKQAKEQRESKPEPRLTNASREVLLRQLMANELTNHTTFYINYGDENSPIAKLIALADRECPKWRKAHPASAVGTLQHYFIMALDIGFEGLLDPAIRRKHEEAKAKERAAARRAAAA